MIEAEKILKVTCPECEGDYALPLDGDTTRRCPLCGERSLAAAWGRAITATSIISGAPLDAHGRYCVALEFAREFKREIGEGFEPDVFMKACRSITEAEYVAKIKAGFEELAS